jgi:hypothetical protein
VLWLLLLLILRDEEGTAIVRALKLGWESRDWGRGSSSLLKVPTDEPGRLLL